MKRSVAEKPQWAQAVPNQALVAYAGGGKLRQGAASFDAKQNGSGWEGGTGRQP